MGRVWLVILMGAAVTAAALIKPVPSGAQAISGVPTEAVGDSVRTAEAAVSDNPGDARAYVRLGHAYLDVGDKGWFTHDVTKNVNDRGVQEILEIKLATPPMELGIPSHNRYMQDLDFRTLQLRGI